MSTYNFTVRSGFAVIVGAHDANDPAAAIYTDHDVTNAAGPVTFALVGPPPTTEVVQPPDHTVNGVTTYPNGTPVVALTQMQAIGHQHKLTPFDSDAQALLAGFIGRIQSPDATCC